MSSIVKNIASKHELDLDAPLDRQEVLDGYQRALAALAAAQQPNGAWAGEVVWNPMLVCQYVICCHVVGREIPPERKARIRKSLEVQLKRDGGWGMHPDVPPPGAPVRAASPSAGLAGEH
ncbi:MAG TPA: hypothetical protein VM869_25000, partial [Enhygromyxa sp.]|nr:hypothetical protein [Enhygromyxa sp.]